MRPLVMIDAVDKELSQSQVRNSTRQHIMRLLLACLDHPAPNIAHFLLGFELRKPVSNTNIQDPGECRLRSRNTRRILFVQQ